MGRMFCTLYAWVSGLPSSTTTSLRVVPSGSWPRLNSSQIRQPSDHMSDAVVKLPGCVDSSGAA